VTVTEMYLHQIIRTGVTDAAGDYDIEVPAGCELIYLVQFEDPSGEHQSEYFDDSYSAASAALLAAVPGASLTADAQLRRFCSIGGTVSGVTGPLAGIAVQVLQGDYVPVTTATTDSSGRYAVPHLPDGSYLVRFSDPSGEYLDATYYADDPLAPAIQLGGGVVDYVADATLVLKCTIHGTLRSDADGSPVTNVDVTAFRADGTPAGSTQSSNLDGTFSVSLPPGVYYLKFGDPSDGGASGPVIPEYFENAVDLASATPLTLSETSRSVQADAFLALRDPDDPGPEPVLPRSVPDGMTTASTKLNGIEGSAIATSGDTVVIGSKWALSRQLQGAGAVFVDVRGVSGWVHQQRLVSPEPSSYACFGNSVAVSGDTLVIGEFRDDGSGQGPGKVHVFVRHAGVWSLQQSLVATGTAASRRGFGESVAVSGDSIVVGAPYATIDGEAEVGAAFVFTRAGTVWAQEKRLLAPSPDGDDFFGQAVALDGDTALVGAYMDDNTAGVNAGSAFVFARDGGLWQRTASLRPSDSDIGNQFGSAVALSGDTALVASERYEYGAGAAFVFVRSGSAWTQQAELAAADGQDDYYFGACVALEGDRALVGAPQAGPWVQYSGLVGAAYSYVRVGADWYQEAKLGNLEETGQSGVGIAVGIGGNELFVASARDRSVDEVNYDAVRVYSPYWVEAGTVLSVATDAGVLANDVAPQGAVLTAALVSQPTHGQLALAPSGSFVYEPDPGYLGTDAFTYSAGCEGWQSDATPVTITVRDLTAPVVSIGDLPKGWVNQPVTVALSTGDVDTEAVEYRRVAPGQWNQYTEPFTISRQGSSSYDVRARDVFGNAARSGFAVKVDTRRPTPKTPYACTVVRGKRAALKYKIVDARPGSPTATVTIRVRNSRNVEKWRVVLKGRTVNKTLAYSFRCSLACGTYRFVVTAKDAAGNRQTKAASNRLTVR